MLDHLHSWQRCVEMGSRYWLLSQTNLQHLQTSERRLHRLGGLTSLCLVMHAVTLPPLEDS